MSVWQNVVLCRFRLVPFLTELRAVMDWVWTDTTLSLSSWICVEDIYAHIFILKCWRESEKVKSPWKCLVPASCWRAPVGYKIKTDAACLRPNGRRWGRETCHELKIQHWFPTHWGCRLSIHFCHCQQQHPGVSSLGNCIVIDVKEGRCCHVTHSPLNAHWGAECRETRVGWAMWTHARHMLSSGGGMGTLIPLAKEMIF